MPMWTSSGQWPGTTKKPANITNKTFCSLKATLFSRIDGWHAITLPHKYTLPWSFEFDTDEWISSLVHHQSNKGCLHPQSYLTGPRKILVRWAKPAAGLPWPSEFLTPFLRLVQTADKAKLSLQDYTQVGSRLPDLPRGHWSLWPQLWQWQQQRRWPVGGWPGHGWRQWRRWHNHATRMVPTGWEFGNLVENDKTDILLPKNLYHKCCMVKLGLWA